MLVAQCFWLAGPVAFAGILHMVVVKKDLFASLKRPIDGGRQLGGKPIFGPNKTWRGLAFMIVASTLLGLVQGTSFGPWAAGAGVAPLDFAAPGRGSCAFGYALVNAVLGLGYGLGELPNSFAKRRIDIVPGKTGAGILGAFFFLLDQADSVVAALGLAALVFGVSFAVFACGSVCLTLLHLAINAGLYAARVRRNL